MGKLRASIRHALRGAGLLLRTQRNARIHVALTVAACALGLALGIGRSGWVGVITAVALVWMAEAFNTALERLGDAVTTETHPGIRDAKDLGAAAVLLAAVGAGVIGAVVFLPELLELVQSRPMSEYMRPGT